VLGSIDAGAAGCEADDTSNGTAFDCCTGEGLVVGWLVWAASGGGTDL
jgi:hypothetical protein